MRRAGLERTVGSLAVALVACNPPGQDDGTSLSGSGETLTTSTGPTTNDSDPSSTTAGSATGTSGVDSTSADEGDTDLPKLDVGNFGDDVPRLPPQCTVGDGELDAVGPCDDQAPPDSFQPDVQWSFPGVGAQTQCLTTPLVANLTDDNGDGAIDLCDIPDVVTVIGVGGETGPGNIVVLDGETGALHFMIPQAVQLGATPALGDIDGDGLVEIVTVTPVAAGQNLVAFEHDGTAKPFGPANWPQSQVGAVALADLDNDGDVEVIAGSNVFDHTGAPIFSAPFDGLYSASTAADLDGDGDLEVILGHAAYHHDGSPYYVNAQLQADTSSIVPYPQVANLDDDPQPEVLVASNYGIWLLEHDGTVAWSDFSPTGEGSDWNRPVAIHDFDGDNESELALSAAAHFGVYEADQGLVFVANTTDSSGQAGGTAFDFLGSGVAQAIYADENTNWVYDVDGTVLMSTPRTSFTWIEYPTVADIDNDGSAEILVGAVGSGFAVQAIRDAQDRWIPARRIWNQHTYHVTNVREDGTIPQFEPPHWESLNTFRTQAQVGAGGGVCKPDPAG
ncbi:MAG: VCBS repeat-containing protein [Myxococcales bacterium]|nr:VCBS repeat-containing protein [Myxococcales bacterium]